MTNERKDYQAVTTKLELNDFTRLNKTCELNDIKVSEYIRNAILSKLNQGAISNIAGKNEIEYNPQKDSFVWNVKLDDGEEIEILKNIAPDFVEDLLAQLKFQIKKREDLLEKNSKNSVAIPKGLVKR